MRQLSVRLYGKPVGVLEQDANGNLLFSYLPTATPISLGMPVREAPYNKSCCEAFFGGFLPESDAARHAIGRKYSVNSNSIFGLLSAIGHECAGAISMHAMEDADASANVPELQGRIMPESELAQHIRDLPKKPLFMGVDGLRLSLAGAQEKAAVCLINDQLAIPREGCPTTHILKPAINQFEETVENEYFCLKVADTIGLPVPKIEIRYAEDIPFLLIERYDREIKDGNVRRIHQEDFCQALGNRYKYANEGGPGFKDCFDLLTRTTIPAQDRNQFVTYLIFNFLIGNNDAHGKNFSLLHESKRIRLAPLYDVLCTRIYPDLSPKMAMKIARHYVPENVYHRHWTQLCTDVGYAFPKMRETILNIAGDVSDSAASVSQKMAVENKSGETLRHVVDFVTAQCKLTIERLSD